MTGADVLDVARDTIWTVLILSAPMMVVALVIGVAISLLQALTQIQEMTLAFIPKIIAMFVTLLLALPFMGDVLQSYMARIAERIISPG
jgi:flagellar biosynthetic protein FliQ